MRTREEAHTGKYGNHVVDWAVFAVLLTAVSAVTLTLFHRQTLGNPGWYHSDMKAYILEMQGLESKYSFPYPVFFKFAALIHLFADPELSVAIATMLLNSLGILITKLAFNRLARKELETAIRRRTAGKKAAGDLSWLAGILISLAAVSLFFISMLYPPEGIYLPGIKYRYLGVFTPNPFHNATYMAARPFAILAFLWYVKLLPVYEKGKGLVSPGRNGSEKAGDFDKQKAPVLWDYILFSVFLLAATMTKPSFTLVMVSTAGLIMLYRLFRTGFRNLVPTLQLGLCFIPTFIDLLYQYKGVFVPGGGEEGGIGFCFGEVWAQCCDNIPLAVCLAVGFPLAVLALNWRECRRSSLFGFSWQFFLVSFGEAFLLYEKGFRKFDFNFSWGYMCGIFFCHLGAMTVLMKATSRRIKKDSGSTIRNVETGKALSAGFWDRFHRILEESPAGVWLIVLQWLIYLWHAACGLYYFSSIYGGAMYY